MEQKGQTYIIAEAGVNHNGSLELAKKLIDAAVAAGADAIKFQTFKTEKLVTKKVPKAEYQIKNTGIIETQFEMIKKLELDEEAHIKLSEYSNDKGIEFLSTPFDTDSIDLLVQKLQIPKLKIASGEITNAPLLLKLARTGKPVILSTGMSTLGEIEAALSILAFGYTEFNKEPSINNFYQAFISSEGQKLLKEKVTILHCTTEYPAPYDEVNLKAIDTLKRAFGLPVGFSDHTKGIAVPIAAVAFGASVIEKHFTLDKTLPGPDHKASLEPDELNALVKAIRQIELALGNSLKGPTPSEIKNISIARKSLVTAKPIKKGEAFTEENLTLKRPGNGISPIYYWDYLNKIADREYEEDELVIP